ncbi:MULTISPECIES: hypothetical protein [Synechococcaceae]|uniref:HNH endonuclease n=1 Tax=Synechococcaceae TaxID=1890426 RepID=UPI0008FF1294|nr:MULTISPECIES: hypothetical protein [Synechococcaceae]MCT4364375.1 hypothetical protein [Candidatus Regnicoccus frigidus MAG-AL1]APD48836.1 hypothetical protein BM449_12025 [Synechococcus sp. SynAce01]MCT0246509.1 hypothetical protein [Synechococcus sp. CS-601]MCT4366239.1 hypothetical protein [Candidatus Regnicoccus frigidus MAG-AL2]TWB93223.1 hypothetical protein FB106_1043 [Synechococcus sp. Ace-Pa]
MEQVFEILADVYKRGRLDAFSDASEVESSTPLLEGSATRIQLNSYERNAKARSLCIDKYGDSCSVCGLNFGQQYGLFAEGYIYAHHLKPLAELGIEYEVDPEKDLRPVRWVPNTTLKTDVRFAYAA